MSKLRVNSLQSGFNVAASAAIERTKPTEINISGSPNSITIPTLNIIQ
jgi:hypothetical protein